MNNKTKNIFIGIISVVAILLLLRVVFDQKFDDFDKYVEDRENYEGGTEEYDKNLKALGDWIENYQKEHPGSTEKDAEKAWEEAWNGK